MQLESKSGLVQIGTSKGRVYLYLEYTLTHLQRVIDDKTIEEIWDNSNDPVPSRVLVT